MDVKHSNDSKEKKRKTHLLIDTQKEIKDEHKHHHHHNHHQDKFKTSIPKSNYDLQKKLNIQTSIEQTEDDKIKNDPSFIIKNRGILKPSRYRNKDKDSLDLYNNKTDINENNDKYSPEIFRTIGKKAPNFSNNFEIKSNFLMELIKRFKTKVVEIHCKLNFISDSNDISSNGIMKNKNNIMKLINFNEVVIFERRIIEFIERQVLNYMKIVNKIESLISDDEINLELLNKFYNDLGKENATIENDRKNISTIEPKDNLLNSSNNNDHFGTDKEKSEKKLFHQRLFLPSLKNLKTSLEKYESFRNSNLKQGSSSVNQTSKHFDLFNPKKGDNILKKIRTITETPALKLKLTENNNENNLIINEEKHEDASIKKDGDNERQNNNNDNIGNNKNDMNKDKTITESEEQKKNYQRPARPRRLSVAQLTMPNYKDINNVNDYILNYKTNQTNKEKEKEKDKNENANDDNEKSKDKLDKSQSKKKKLKLRLTKDILDDVKVKFKELNNKSSKNKNKEIETHDSNNLDNSMSSKEVKTNNLKNEKEPNNLNTSIISNVGTKDPLDDIRYLHKIRKGHEKSLYRNNSIIIEEKSEKKEEEEKEEEDEEEEEEEEEVDF